MALYRKKYLWQNAKGICVGERPRPALEWDMGPEPASEMTWPHKLNSKDCPGPSSDSSKGLNEGANRSSRGGRYKKPPQKTQTNPLINWLQTSISTGISSWGPSWGPLFKHEASLQGVCGPRSCSVRGSRRMRKKLCARSHVLETLVCIVSEILPL